MAALVGALAAALNEKVARLTKDPSARTLAVRMAAARARLLKLVDEDAYSYQAVVAAWKGEPSARQRALKQATRVPLAICADSAIIADVARRLALLAKAAIRADAKAAERLAHAALGAAQLMVETNLPFVDDVAFVRSTHRQLKQHNASCQQQPS